MYNFVQSFDGFEISKEIDKHGPFIKATSSVNQRNHAIYRHYFVETEKGELKKTKIAHDTIDEVFDFIKKKGVSKGFYIPEISLKKQNRSVSKKTKGFRLSQRSIRHHKTNEETSYTSTGEKLDSHWPIFKKLSETGYGSIIRSTMTLHQVCLSKCSFCSTINRDRKDSISLSEAKGFIKSLYFDQAAFNQKQFRSYNELYKKYLGSDIRLRGLILSGGGQPNLWPHFSEFVDWLSQKDIDLGLITNGFPKHVDQRIYRHFKWIRLSITPEDASPFYIDGKFNNQYIPESILQNETQTFGLSYVYGPWTTDDFLKRLDTAGINWGAKYIRLLTDCNLPRDLQLSAHKDLGERLYKLRFVDANGKPLSRIFHQLKYHGNKKEIRDLWPDKICKLQTYNTFWDTTGHEKNGVSYCYPCDSVTVLEEDIDGQNAERRFNSEKWGTTINTEVHKLFSEPVKSFFDPNKNCQACLFIKNNRRVHRLTDMRDFQYINLVKVKKIEHVNFP